MGRQDGSSRRTTEADSGDRTATILHVDLDAFFVSVALLDRPELRDKPVAIGHRSPRSVLSAANYVARTYGVNSAMPVGQALRKCPNLILLDPQYERYKAISRQVMGMFEDITPHVEPLSIDEAFLDIRGALSLFGTPFQIATRLRERVFAETGLHCSVGLASTKFVAKLASGLAKPDGLLQIPAEETVAFLRPLPIRLLWGVGPVAEAKLARLGLKTVADVADTPLEVLQRHLGPGSAAHLHALAQGQDPRGVKATREERTISHEHTFGEDVDDEDVLAAVMLDLSMKVAKRLRAKDLVASTITVKARFGDFVTVTRSRTLPVPTDVGVDIAEHARSLLAEARPYGEAMRLIGVGTSGLQPADRRDAGLWDDAAEWSALERVGDELQRRFGGAAPKPARLLKPAPEQHWTSRTVPEADETAPES